jgi:hypothetical protein
MIGLDFTFKDFNGVERKEKHFFHISEEELMDMELSEQGGFKAKLERLTDSIDVPEINKIFREMIQKSYGVKSADGRRFSKSPEHFEEFKDTPAYSQLVMNCLQDVNYALAFLKGIMPRNLSATEEANLKLELSKKGVEVSD